jgi:hypothetical protein
MSSIQDTPPKVDTNSEWKTKLVELQDELVSLMAIIDKRSDRELVSTNPAIPDLIVHHVMEALDIYGV